MTEEVRLKLYSWVVESAGKEVGAAMMELLPPTGWGDVATRQQMEREFVLMRNEMERESVLMRNEMERESVLMRNEMGREFATLRSEMAQLELKLDLKMQQKLNQHLYATAGLFVSANALAVAAVKLLA